MSDTHTTSDPHTAAPMRDETAGVTRRELFQLGNVLALPVLFGTTGMAGTARMSAEAAPAGPLKPGPEIYQSIGVEPIINCRGTFTIIGGSVELPEVRAAMDSASRYFVQIDELADAVGQRLAELTNAEWGMVSSGCAAGLKHVTVACVTGGNPEKLVRIPDLTGFEKTEVIAPRYARNVYDAALHNVGVTIIAVDTPEQLIGAINPRTAMIYLMAGEGSESGPLSLEAIATIAKPKNIPILIDAAAEILTIPNVHLQRGATIVAYSGGKALRGPQCAGLLLGRKDILMSAWQASAPHHGPGRDNKVGREEVLGMLAAVEAWVKRDHPAEWKTWLSWLNTVSTRVTAIDGVKAAVREPTGLSNRTPALVVTWDPNRFHVTGEELAEELAKNKPRIAVGAGGGGGQSGMTSVSVTAWMMQPGDDKVVAERLHAALSQRRTPRSTSVAAPASNIAGQWEIDIEFYSGKSRHTILVHQDGNWLEGSHQGDFTARDLAGTIEGTQVKFRSMERRSGSAVPFLFVGTLTDNTIAGDVYMGEYLNAKFTARRHTYNTPRGPIRVPSGRPLAT